MRALLVPFIAIQLLAFPAYCHAVYCGNKIISEGDKLGDVLEKCGPPLITEKSRVELVKDFGSGVVRTAYKTTEYLLYDLGPDVFVRIMRFEDDRLMEILTAEYGGKREPRPSRCVPPGIEVVPGDTMAHVRYRCGSPDLIETPEEVTEKIGPVQDYYLSVKKQVVEWSYTSGEEALSVFRFDNGILAAIYQRDADRE